MDKSRELYHEEIKALRDFKGKIDTHAIYKEDLDDFSDQYEELVAQAKVITRVSDRLQKKLDTANIQIREQNEEIKEKNIELEKTIQQLVQARVGRRASTIMFTVAILLFISEEYYLESMISNIVSVWYFDLAIKGGLAVILKFLESGLESYFLNREKKKIIKQEKSNELQTAIG
ncbi:MAG: hypothetical protein KI790_03255 [Cyclobacteriaceae bacterium]|nr:hypothetical protein [Cyclobacteriaceae bacterium HetDA_MAG_MS6]